MLKSLGGVGGRRWEVDQNKRQVTSIINFKKSTQLISVVFWSSGIA